MDPLRKSAGHPSSVVEVDASSGNSAPANVVLSKGKEAASRGHKLCQRWLASGHTKDLRSFCVSLVASFLALLMGS